MSTLTQTQAGVQAPVPTFTQVRADPQAKSKGISIAQAVYGGLAK
jgi:hypothetical protein